VTSGRRDEKERDSQDILFVTAAYAPVNVPGTIRMLRFTRWVRDWGYGVRVLTLKLAPYSSWPIDQDLLRHIPEGVEAVRVGGLYPIQFLGRLRRRVTNAATAAPRSPATSPKARRSLLSDLVQAVFATPDNDIGWVPTAVLSGLRMAARRKPSWIISSGPPHSVHVAAAALRILLRTRWLADFRDPWVGNPQASDLYENAFARRISQYEERLTVRRADAVVLNTAALQRHFQKRYPENAAKFWCIPNGFDQAVEQRPTLEVSRSNGAIRITHAGRLYAERDPRPLIQAIANLIADGRAKAGSVELLLVGDLNPPFRVAETAKDLGIEDCIRLLPTVPVDEARKLMAESSVLLLIQPQAAMQVPSKVFEYLGLGRPILALVDPGATAELIEQAGVGVMAPPNDVGRIEEALATLLEPTYRCEPNWEYLAGFSPESLSLRLAKILGSSGAAAVPCNDGHAVV
jgi:glycosyltransferase involved in cell wall biosynthesis